MSLLPPESRQPVRWSIGLMLALSYWAVAKGGLFLATINHHVSPVWPASGLAIAALMLLGRGYWPFIWAGAFAANLFLGSPLWTVFLIACGNTLEAVVAKYYFRRFTSIDRNETEIPLIAGLAASAFFGATTAALFGSLSLALAGIVPWGEWSTSAITWWTGDAIGMLLIVPFAIRARNLDYSTVTWRKAAEFVVYLSAIALLGSLTIWAKPSYTALIMFLFPLLLIGVARLGAVETGVSLFLIVGMAVAATLQGQGPFYGGSENTNLVQLQLFIASLAVTKLVLRSLRRTGNLRSAAIVLLIGWLVTGLVFDSFNRKESEIDQARFHRLVSDANIKLSERVLLFEVTFRSGAGLLKASPQINVLDWRSFASELEQRNFPGFYGLGYILSVPNARLKEWVARESRKRGNEFKYIALDYPGMERSPGPIENHYVIMAFEPKKSTRTIPGMDVSTERNRAAALTRARDSGQTILSDRMDFKWLRETSGYIAFAPVYRASGPTTPTERRAAFVGWVYSPIMLEHFLQGIFPADSPEIAVEAQVGDDPPVAMPANESDFNRRHHLETELQLWGKTLKMRWVRTPDFQSRKDTSAAWIQFIGVVVALLLAALVAVFENLFQQAQRIADQKTREVALRDRLWTSLTRVVPAAIFQLDRQGRLAFVNEKWVEYTKIDPARDPAASWLSAIDPGDRPLVDSRWEDLRSGQIELLQVQCRMPVSAKTFAMSVRSVQEENGVVSHFIGTLHDITEIHARQMQIMHSSRMASVGVMAAGMAHEINNPLTIITGRAQLILKHLETGNVPVAALRESTQIIKQTVDRIARIVRGLRSFSRGGEGDSFLLASVPDIIQSTAEFCSERFKKHGVELRVKPVPAIELGCREVQVSQVLLNLINNGFDAASAQPEKWVEVEVIDGDEVIEFRVTDSGRGIPPSVAEKIMIPFFTTKPVGQGTGLGLSISKGIAQDHCGDLVINTDSPHTCFVFTVSKRLLDDGTVLAAL
jgi:signal transduction histidine kinase/integral membrane sensor domain MASE1